MKKETQAETSAADDDCPPGCAKRIEKLEADVEKLAKATTRLADVLEALDKKLDAKQDKPNP